MTYTFFEWFQGFITGSSNAFDFLLSKPFADIKGVPTELQNITPLMLVGISGLLIFIIVAVVKWIIK